MFSNLRYRQTCRQTCSLDVSEGAVGGELSKTGDSAVAYLHNLKLLQRQQLRPRIASLCGSSRPSTNSSFRTKTQLLTYLTSILLPILCFWNVDYSRQRLASALETPKLHGTIFPVVLPTRYIFDSTAVVLQPRSKVSREHQELAKKPSYGGIELYSIGNEKEFARSIQQDDNKFDNNQKERRPNKRKYKYMSLEPPKTAAGGRDTSDQYLHYDEIDYPKPDGCYKPKWAFAYYPSCNAFHELSLERPVSVAESLNVTYVGQGVYRSGWSVVDEHANYDLVLKTVRLRDNAETISTSGIHMTQVEAITMLETAGSNHTTNIYGHCSTSVMVEHGEFLRRFSSWGWRDQTKLDEEQLSGVQSQNDNTPEEKLQMALHMAEGIADMHGNPRGVIVNHDISPQQWVLGKDGIIKLNDFNWAKILKWNAKEQRYCKNRGQKIIQFSAPEEMYGAEVDETTDTNTFGKIMYMLLVGLKPYYHLGSDEATAEAILAGEFPYVDPRFRTRSFIERRLVEIMEKTWNMNPSERPSIFDIIQDLRETSRLAALAGGAGSDRQKQ